MQEPWSIEKVMEIDTHIGCAMSGLVADAKMLVDHARAETQVCLCSPSLFAPGFHADCDHAEDAQYVPHMPVPQQHRFSYNEAMPVESVTQSLCDLALRFGEDSDEGGGLVSVHHGCKK